MYMCTCKHISAVLLKCTRSNVYLLEKLSSTDLKCYWTNKKKTVQQEYEAKPLLETICFASKVKERNELTSEQQLECFSILTSVCDESSLTRHLKGRTLKPCSSNKVPNEELMSEDIKAIITCATGSTFLNKLALDIENFVEKPCCKDLAVEIFNLIAFYEAIAAKQGSGIWHQERQFRITGSRCYSIYTFMKENWEIKARNHFWPKKFQNKYVKHGLKFEREALEKYREVNNYNVCEVGVLICQQYPWLAYSPDGITMNNGIPERLVEIKCPYDGIDNGAISFVHTCAYLEIGLEKGVTLKKKRAYYGQVQLGMALLNLQICDFIIYFSKSKHFLIYWYHSMKSLLIL